MKLHIFIKTIIPFIVIVSCISKEPESNYNNKNLFELGRSLDDYPISDKMFDLEKEIIIGNYGSNCNWFINDTLDEVLVFNLYTDYHRMYTFHFLRNKFPINFLKEIPFNSYHKDTSTKYIDEKTFFKYVEKSKKISRNYFVTKSGIYLGEEESKILNKFGKPNKIETFDKFKKLTWGEKTKRIELFFIDKKLASIAIYRDLI
jgi:hypothetical protein